MFHPALTSFSVILAFAVLSLPGTAFAEKLGTLPRGKWHCELPGDVAGTFTIKQEEENFIILSASRYQGAEGKIGTYLRRGKQILMTSGPKKGQRYHLRSARIVRKLKNDGTPGPLRCVHLTSDRPL
ncbi:elongation factor P [Altericroceibacterium spongiae]|uniref:Elongation factor P n=1 Tax=Altericroceibacterium spongiae TaxID=2320269 RepID=A0A420ER97_9SPHN|nr:elongation factor P [Altericroceibacterium spongiae]RKF23205.1 elongation factor P [Altericroceibacterium spongiae]